MVAQLSAPQEAEEKGQLFTGRQTWPSPLTGLQLSMQTVSREAFGDV